VASTTALKRRIGSVKNTKQITKAMELVAASKMRKAQEHAMLSRDFKHLANQILTRLSEVMDVEKHPLFATRPLSHRLHILIMSDRGLAGAYNSNLLRALVKQLTIDKENDTKSSIILIGRKGHAIVSKIEGVDIIAAYDNFPEQPLAHDIQPILQMVTEKYRNQEVDAVDVTYTEYKSSILQEVQTERLLPAAYREIKISPDLEQAIIEPSPEAVLEQASQRLIEVQLNQMFNESQASEQSARMMAMKNATDNAGDLIDDLTLAFNTARQAGITQELAEITGGAEAMK
jgi:F-type H+-transporting ATPase subunit gamma